MTNPSDDFDKALKNGIEAAVLCSLAPIMAEMKEMADRIDTIEYQNSIIMAGRDQTNVDVVCRIKELGREMKDHHADLRGMLESVKDEASKDSLTRDADFLNLVQTIENFDT